MNEREPARVAAIAAAVSAAAVDGPRKRLTGWPTNCREPIDGHTEPEW